MAIRFIQKNSGPESVLDELLTPAQVTTIIPVTVGTLRVRRHQGKGPSYIKIDPDGAVRYRLSVVDPAGIHRLAIKNAASHLLRNATETHLGRRVISGSGRRVS